MSYHPTRIRVALPAALLGLALLNGGAAAQEKDTARDARRYAEAEIQAIGDSGVTGRMEFRHAGAFVFITGAVSGLAPGKHGMHVHEGASCDQRGGHYNPGGTPHGSPDQPSELRHVGDLGNLVAQRNGRAEYSRIDGLARLDGPHSIIGRVLVVHAGEDDYLTQPSGASGKEIGCGVIRWVSP